MDPGPGFSVVRNTTVLSRFYHLLRPNPEGTGFWPFIPPVLQRCELKFRPPELWFTPTQIFIAMVEISPKTTFDTEIGCALWMCIDQMLKMQDFLDSKEAPLAKIARKLQREVVVQPTLTGLSPFYGEDTKGLNTERCILESIEMHRDLEFEITGWTIHFTTRQFHDYTESGNLTDLCDLFI